MDPSVLDDIINRLLEGQGRQVKQVQLSEPEIRQLCDICKEIFLLQPNLLELQAPIKICGDIHGQYSDLLMLFECGGFPPDANYLFLGNYVDRGRQSIETICLLLAYKIKYPENFFLPRGNHECASINRIFGFYDECKRRYTVKLWKAFTDCFNCLPVAALVDVKIFCLHGVLSRDLNSLDQIRNLPRPTDVTDAGLLCDLLWSNLDNNDQGRRVNESPSHEEFQGWGRNTSPSDDAQSWRIDDNGVSVPFGPDRVSEFLKKNNLDLTCRGRQVVEYGHEFFAGRQVVTIFSAPNFCGDFTMPAHL